MDRTAILLFCAIALSSAGLAFCGEQPPWTVNDPIVNVEKSVYKSCPKPDAGSPIVEAYYTGPNLERTELHGLTKASDSAVDLAWRFSGDNGKTWTKLQPLDQPATHVRYKGVTVRECAATQIFDPQSGVLLGMWLRQHNVGGLFHNATYWRISRDHGRTWSQPRQLRYEDGPEFDPQDPLNASFLKRNQGYPGSNILICGDGSLVFAVSHANAPGDAKNDKRPWLMGSVLFIDKWNEQAQDYEWTPGARVEISPEQSARGLMEPEIAELRDGRLLVVWRGSTHGWDGTVTKIPGCKFYSISSDDGRTLDPPRQWKYADGTSFYSPSSYHRMIRHSVTGKLYWIGNICAAPPRGNSPRYPLVIAEVDESAAALKKETVSVIDDRQPGQPASIQFSNFSLLEDRVTHTLELYMTAYGENKKSVWNANCYKYEVTVK